MPVDLPPDPQPSSTQSRSAFVAAMAALVDWFYVAIPQLRDALTALNFNSTNGTSATSVAIGTGSKSFTANTSKSWVIGMTLKIANSSTNWMIGEVTSYNSGTGALVMNIRQTLGSGTYSDWTISLASSEIPIGDIEIIVHTGNGYGSTNTKRRRYTTKVKDTAAGQIVYADSPTLGATFTIHEAGDYLITRCEKYGSSAGRGGIALNASSGTSGFTALTYAERLIGIACDNTKIFGSATVLRKLSVNDVISAHDDGVLFNDTTDATFMSVKRIS